MRSMVRIWSSVWMEGERPPCTQKICRDTRVLNMCDACAAPPPPQPREAGGTSGGKQAPESNPRGLPMPPRVLSVSLTCF